MCYIIDRKCILPFYTYAYLIYYNNALLHDIHSILVLDAKFNFNIKIYLCVIHSRYYLKYYFTRDDEI